MLDEAMRQIRGQPRPVPSTNEIKMYFHCKRCLEEVPPGQSPADYQRIQAGFTPLGIQVWCNRHDANIVHIDFEHHTHPANLNAAKDH